MRGVPPEPSDRTADCASQKPADGRRLHQVLVERVNVFRTGEVCRV
mgnify:CR=1 FL=1